MSLTTCMLSQQCARSADRLQVCPTSLHPKGVGVGVGGELALHRPLGNGKGRKEVEVRRHVEGGRGTVRCS